MSIRDLLSSGVVGILALVMAGCAGKSDKLGDAFEPLPPTKPEATSASVPSESTPSKTDAAPSVAAPIVKPPSNQQKLTELFKTLGYEGIGLQYESEATLELLIRVFSDPRATNRQIKLVYTGLAMAYDSLPQSLTVGGTFDANVILAFIQKRIPNR